MPVGSHKDAFKAHQLVKKIAGKDSNAKLVKMASNILMDFVKSQRQVNAQNTVETLPTDGTKYDQDKLNKALKAVDKLCGKCDESHDDSCFVNQTRRALICAKTGVDPGSAFDGKKSLEELIEEAEKIASEHHDDSESEQTSELQDSTPELVSTDDCGKLQMELDDLKEKDVFRSTLIDEIVETIQSVAEGNFAAKMPVHDDEQLGKLATAFNLMLDTVNNTMSNLDKLVAERSAEMKMIMNTVPVGLLSVSMNNDDIRINPEYSKACEDILKLNDLRGRNFLDSIGLVKRRKDEREELEKFLDLFAQQLIPAEDMAGLNPFEEIELKRDESTIWLKLKYHIIDKGEDAKPDLLVVMEDITHQKAMQEEIAKSERENMQLKAIAEDPDLFCEFLGETKKIINDSSDLANNLTLDDFKESVNSIFRGVHTIKGTAASFSLNALSDQAAVIENILDQMRQLDNISNENISDIKQSLNDLNISVNEIVEKTEKLLGHSISSDGEITLKIPASSIKNIINSIDSSPISKNYKNNFISDLENFRKIPVKKGLGQSLKIIPSLINRLNKDIDFVLNDYDIKIDCDIARDLNTPFVHLIRNAFDHGIEYPDERIEAGKPEKGTVKLSVLEQDDFLILTISDDGKGLNPDQIKESALNKGVISSEEADQLSKEDIYNLIFKPGFSTAKEVSDVSGRGVGMDAVLSTIKDILNGEISIESELSKGSSFIIKIPIKTGSKKEPEYEKILFGFANGKFYKFNITDFDEVNGMKINKDMVPEFLLKKWEEKGLI